MKPLYLTMKRRVIYTTRFKKDLKKFKNDLKRRKKIIDAVELLATGKEIPDQMRPYSLLGNYSGHLEMHIEGDLLLIWLEKTSDDELCISLVRLGSHSDLF